MRQVRPWVSRWGTLVVGVAVLGSLACGTLAGAAAATPATGTVTAPAEMVTGVWQHHKVTFSYFGITSLFTCDGLEDQVRQILLHLGARRDAKVRASGCPGPYNTPSRSAWVDADFYSLAPAADTKRADTVKASWTPLEVTARRPDFMGDGDCELIQAMKDLITKNFTLRDVEYRANCVPHEQWMDSFAVKGQALRAVPLKSNALQRLTGTVGAAFPAGTSATPIIHRRAHGCRHVKERNHR
jgi:hypothetical protein